MLVNEAFFFWQKAYQWFGYSRFDEDLGVALNENPEMIFKGGGNPARSRNGSCF